MYLNNLSNFVCDENRTVTYKWLSNVLSVPSDLAKKMLYAFVKQQGNNVQAIYAISGNNKKTQQHEFRLVASTKLEDTKEEFDPILSLHVYSVQKSIPKDSASLWNVEYEQFNEFVSARKLESYVDNRWSGIKYDYERRKGTEGQTLGTGAVPQVSVKSEPKAKENNMNLLNSKPASNGVTVKGLQSIQQQLQKLQQDKPKASDKETKATESKLEPSKAEKDKSPNKKVSDSKSVSSFFKPVAKQTSAPATDKTTEAPKSDATHAKDVTSPAAKPAKPEAKKETKQVSKKETKKEKEDTMEVEEPEIVPAKEDSDKEDAILDKSESSSDSEAKEHSDSESELSDSNVDSDARDSDANSKRRKKRAVSPIRAPKPKKTEKPKAQPKKAKQEDDETVVIKSASKRKRVVEDSDESDNDIVEEDKPKKKKKAPKQAPPSQSNTLDSLAVALQPAVRMKKIKVTKSRINEKGYMVFEDIEEEVPDDSPLPDTPSPAKPNADAKAKSPQADPEKTKQKNIMSFFRKK